MKQILDFNETTVEEVMTPRTRIETFADSMTVQEAIDMMLTYSHSRIPVYHDKLDDANRVVTLRQLASYVAQ